MDCTPWHPTDAPSSRSVVVCLPVCNEAEHIKACLEAFAEQDFAGPFILVLLLNNCTDGTAQIVAAFEPPPRMHLQVESRIFPSHEASAGYARHVAMQAARQLAAPTGVLLCTDADAIVPEDWIRQNLEAIAVGADAVAGRIEMDAVDFKRLPSRLHDDEAAAQLLTCLIDQIDSVVDPDASDPWPRHAEHSGASIAVTCAAYDAVGGIPNLPSSEDRAFFSALRRIGARIRHAPDIVVTVSGRLEGRAKGGMAETLRRRLVAPDAFLDDSIETAEKRRRRAHMRGQLREMHAAFVRGELPRQNAKKMWDLIGLPADLFFHLKNSIAFGALWQALEPRIPELRQEPIPSSRVESEIASAYAILELEKARAAFLQPRKAHRMLSAVR